MHCALARMRQNRRRRVAHATFNAQAPETDSIAPAWLAMRWPSCAMFYAGECCQAMLWQGSHRRSKPFIATVNLSGKEDSAGHKATLVACHPIYCAGKAHLMKVPPYVSL